MYIKLITYIFIDPSNCLREIDAEWNITWPLTASGDTAQQKCPGGAESVGMCYYFP